MYWEAGERSVLRVDVEAIKREEDTDLNGARPGSEDALTPVSRVKVHWGFAMVMRSDGEERRGAAVAEISEEDHVVPNRKMSEHTVYQS